MCFAGTEAWQVVGSGGGEQVVLDACSRPKSWWHLGMQAPAFDTADPATIQMLSQTRKNISIKTDIGSIGSTNEDSIL